MSWYASFRGAGPVVDVHYGIGDNNNRRRDAFVLGFVISNAFETPPDAIITPKLCMSCYDIYIHG